MDHDERNLLRRERRLERCAQHQRHRVDRSAEHRQDLQLHAELQRTGRLDGADRDGRRQRDAAGADGDDLSEPDDRSASGGTSTLTWSSTNATSCTASGGWSGSRPTSGTFVTPALTQTTHVRARLHRCRRNRHRFGHGDRDGAADRRRFPAACRLPDQRHLIDQNNKPFLVVGDTPWSLMTGVTKAEAEAYLEDRRQRGFNAIIVNIIEHYFNGPSTRKATRRSRRPGNVYDFSKPIEAYFAHVDYVLGLARDKGILVLLTPAYLGYGGGSEGWWPEINTAVNTEAVMENYGRYLGTRYRNFNNILWVMGGDWYGQESLPKTQALVRGLQATDQAGGCSLRTTRARSPAIVYYGSEPWFTVNTTYSRLHADATALDRRLPARASHALRLLRGPVRERK